MSWQASYEKVYPGMNKKMIWAAWEDVNSWQKWDDELEFAKLQGPFQKGAVFSLRPKGGPTVSIEITDLEHGRSFTDRTKFPLAQMLDTHEMEDTPEGLKIRSIIRVQGPLAWLWRKLVAQGVADGAAKQIDALVKYAQKQKSGS